MATCVVCGREITNPARKILCSFRCARIRQKEQIGNANALRKTVRKTVRSERLANCSICGAEFGKYHNNSKYCGEPCRKRALYNAVKAQRQRRKEVNV